MERQDKELFWWESCLVFEEHSKEDINVDKMEMKLRRELSCSLENVLCCRYGYEKNPHHQLEQTSQLW